MNWRKIIMAGIAGLGVAGGIGAEPAAVPGREPLFLNVTPLFPEDPEYVAEQAIRVADATGTRYFLYSLTLNPQGTPAIDAAKAKIAAFGKVRELLKSRPDVRCGVLFQALQGHGWNGAIPLTGEPWQLAVSSEGKSLGRPCALDPGFQAYVLEVVREVMKCRPAILMTDDDFSCNVNSNQCYCPLHLAEYNRRLGTDYDRETLVKKLEAAAPGSELVKAVTAVQNESTVALARKMRQVMDEFDPAIRCGVSFSEDGAVQPELTRALAGNTKPFTRIACCVYTSYQFPQTLTWADRTAGIRTVMIADDVDKIVEADTFPQCVYSVSAALFNAHVTLQLLNGMCGAKLWNTDMHNPLPESGREFEEIMARNVGRYKAIIGFNRELTPVGLQIPIPDFTHNYHPLHALDYVNNLDTFADWWFSIIGVPYYFGNQPGKKTRMLAGVAADRFSDAEIREFFKGNLLLDGPAVKKLAARGFAPLMGIKVEERENFIFQYGIGKRDGHKTSLVYQPEMPQMQPDGAEELLSMFDGISIPHQRVAAGVTAFTNALGGRVVCMAVPVKYGPHAHFNSGCRMDVAEALRYLEGGVLPVRVTDERAIFCRAWKMKDGALLTALFPIQMGGFRTIGLELRGGVPKKAELLTEGGQWIPAAFTEEAGGRIRMQGKWDVLEPAVFRFYFER